MTDPLTEARGRGLKPPDHPDGLDAARGILANCIWAIGLWGLVFIAVGAYLAVKGNDVRILIWFGIVWVLLSVIYGLHCLSKAQKKGRAADPPQDPYKGYSGGHHYAGFYRGNPDRRRRADGAPTRDR